LLFVGLDSRTSAAGISLNSRREHLNENQSHDAFVVLRTVSLSIG